MKRGASDQLTVPKPKRARRPVFQVIRPRTDISSAASQSALPTAQETQTRTTTLRQLQNGRFGQRRKDKDVALPSAASPDNGIDDIHTSADNPQLDVQSTGLDDADSQTTDTVAPKTRKKNTTTVRRSWDI